MILDLHFSHKPKKFKFWHLDPLLLADDAFCQYVSESIKYFYDTNKSEETSASLLWDTLKAFLRGEIISYTAYANRAHKARQVELEKALSNLDLSLSTNPTPDLYKERLTLQTELDLLLTRDAEHLLLQSQGTRYEHGDKAGCLLAHQLKARLASNQITQILDDKGTLISDPDAINYTVRAYYCHLYIRICE